MDELAIRVRVREVVNGGNGITSPVTRTRVEGSHSEIYSGLWGGIARHTAPLLEPFVGRQVLVVRKKNRGIPS